MFIFMSLRARFSAYTRKLYSLFFLSQQRKIVRMPVSGATAEVNENDDKIPFSWTQCKHFLRKTHRSDSGVSGKGTECGSDCIKCSLEGSCLRKNLWGEVSYRLISSSWVKVSMLTHVCWRRKFFFCQTLSAGRQNYVNCSQNRNFSRSKFI